MSRVIHTDTYTEDTAKILNAVRIYMKTFWGSTQMRRNAEIATVEVQPNGEVTWTVNDSSWYAYHKSFYNDRNDARVREWLACTMKTITYRMLKMDGVQPSKAWKRSNKHDILHFKIPTNVVGEYKFEDVPVSDIYCLFDMLLGRKTVAKRWGKKAKAMAGQERDAVATELEVARREEVANLRKKYDEDDTRLTNEKYAAIDEATKRIREEYAKKAAELKAAYLQSVKELNESMNFMAGL
jgi:hypothetical protein